MANSDKDILITPNSGSSSADPKIEYVGANSSGNDTITVETLYDGTKATLSFEGSAGQLFSVVNDLSSDPIFSVNDVSGIPSIEVDSDGEIRLAEFSGNVGIGISTPTELLHVDGRIKANNLTLASLSAQNSEATAVMIDGSGIIGTRELGSNAFNSTSYLTGNQTITLGGDVTGSGTTSITVSINDDSHNHIISNVDGLQTALDGKLSTSGTAANATLFDNMDSTRFIFGSNTSGTNEATVTDWNSVSKSGFYSDDGASNKWSTSNWSSIIHIKLYDNNNNYASQLGFDTYNPDLYYRMNNNGTWTSWYEIYHEGHKPTYSELGTMAYSNLTGTPTIPTNNNQLTNGAGYLTSSSGLNASNLTSGTVPDARIAASSITQHTDSKYLRSNANDTLSSTLKVTGSIIHEFNTSGGYIARPKGAQYVTTTGTVTGAIKIKLPTHGTDDMLSFWVDIYDYTSGESVTMWIGGYVYQTTGNNEWVNETALIFTEQTGKAPENVRFGADGSNQCVWIGETTDTWSYPQVIVRDFQCGYTSDIDAYDDNWAISFVTSFDTVDTTRSAKGPVTEWDRVESKPSFATVATSGSYNDLSNTPTIPTNNNQLTNGANYITASNSAITNKLPLAGGTMTGDITISNTSPALNLVDSNSFSDANDRFVYRAADNRVRWEWYDNSASTTTTVLDLDSTGLLKTNDVRLNAGYTLQRSDHHSGHLEGSYNNVAANSTKTNPIYSIGSSYNPNEDTLNNFYGIGYSKNSASFMTGALDAGNNNGWGLYVAADGDARIFLNGSHGIISSTGEHYVNSQRVFHDGYHPNADKWTTARTLTLNGDVTGSVSWDGSGNASITTTATSDPTLTLSGDASGSATFTNLGNATLSVSVNDDSHFHHRLDSTDDRDMKPSTSGIAGSVQALKPFFSSYGGMTGSANTTYVDVLAFDTYSDSSGGGPSAITFKKGNASGNPEMHIWKAAWNATTWGTGQRVFADNYHPNADKWTTARTITLGGDLTGNVSIDGSANVTLTAAVVDDSHNHDASNINSGRLGDARMPTTIGGSASTTFIGTLSGNANTASNTPVYTTGANSTHYVTFALTNGGGSSDGTGSQARLTDAGLTYNPSTNALSVTGGFSAGSVDSGGDVAADGHFYGRAVNNAYSNIYRIGGVYFTWDSDNYGTQFDHSLTSSYGGTYADDITLNSYHRIRLNIDSNNNNGLTTEAFEIGHNTTGTGNRLFQINGNALMTLGYDGKNPLFRMEYDNNHASGDRWDTLIEIGRSNEFQINDGSYPLYEPANAGHYGMKFQGNSDAVFFGAEQYTSGNYRPVIAWGDNTSDSPFFIRYNWGTKFAFTYNGIFHADNDVIAYSTTTSDARYKDNVSTIENALDKVQKLRGVEFDWNATSRKGKHDIGFIAQEIEEVIPEVVTEQEMLVGDFEEKEEKAKTVAYGQVTALLVEAIKEQQETINKLIDRINDLEKGE